MRHILLRTWVVVLGLCLLGLAFPAWGSLAQDPAPVEVRVAPSTIQAARGGQIEIAVEVVEVQDLYGFDVILTFDPAVVQVVDADPLLDGVQVSLGTLLEPGFAVRNTADNAAGRLQFAMTQLNPSEAKSGTGTLIVVKFEGQQVDASAPLTLEKAQLAQRDGIEIPSELVAGQVIVGSAPAGPTNTPLPTQPAGSPVPTLGPMVTGALPTEAPPADTPVAPADTPLATSPPAPTATPIPGATDPGAAATAVPPSEPSAAATATPVPPAASPLPTQTPEPTSPPAPTAAQPTVVVQVQVQPDEPAEPAPAEGQPAANNSRVLLIVGIVALGLAAVAGIIIVALLAGLFLTRGGSASE